VSRRPDLSIVVCSFNGASGLGRCLRALDRQTVQPLVEVIVVDDGSSDGTSEVAARFGGIVVRHPENRGISAARNTGIDRATADIVAFLDDDCEPEPDWAEKLLAAYGGAGEIVGVGGPVLPAPGRGYMLGFLSRHNPLEPLGLELAAGESLPYRLALYLRAQWHGPAERTHRSAVYSLVGANMSFRRRALDEVGRFDERFTFGGEDTDICRRLAGRWPGASLVYDPTVRVVHHFEPSLRDTLRRSRAYGRGAARLRRKWPTMRPTIYPWPVLVAALVAVSWWAPLLGALALIAPPVFYPSSVRTWLRERHPVVLVDPYVRLAQEASGNIGLLTGLWRYRRLPREQGTVAVGLYPSLRR
jgi:GT2 family glycosyltransferase